MLRWSFIARLALNHSPEKEQRLLSWAKKDDANSQRDIINLGAERAMRKSRAEGEQKQVLSERQQFHDAIFNAADLESKRTVIADYLPEILSITGGTKEDVLASDTDELIEMTRGAIVDRMNLEERERTVLASALEDKDTSVMSEADMRSFIETHRSTMLRYVSPTLFKDPPVAINLVQALLHQDIERMRRRKYEKEQGVTWTFLLHEDFEAEFKKRSRQSETELPSAFMVGNKMYFDVDHPDFSSAPDRELRAKRAVIHEVTHFAVDDEKKGMSLEKWASTLRSHPQWNELKAALEELFASSRVLGKVPTVKKMVDEALAIYCTAKRAPRSVEGSSARARIVSTMDEMFANPHTGYLTTLRETLNVNVDRLLETDTRDENDPNAPTIASMLLTAADDRNAHRQLAVDLDLKDGEEVRTNTEDEGAAAVRRELKEDEDESRKKDSVTTQQVLSALQGMDSKIQEMRRHSQELENMAAAFIDDNEEREEMLAGLREQRSFFSDMGTDLVKLTRETTVLHNWEELSLEEKKEAASRMNFKNHLYDQVGTEGVTMEQADKQSKESRKKALYAINKILGQWKKMADNMSKALTIGNEHRERIDTAGGPDTGVLTWMKKLVTTNEAGIVWLSPLNIWHIVKTYRDAIVEQYKSGQLVKENAIAKKIGDSLFFFKPIQHSLKKLARSTNNKESSEFREYLEQEGYTFDEVFGPDGKGNTKGLLFENRGNFNRAKAVLEYAADHAWLYHMDRLNGHDVYGIDFETIEGHQSFEELVQRHEAGKDKQIKHGIERVDRDPDVKPIMDAMVHELKHKNIFAVQGIMQRLQDKAKYSHSNTWMLTTLLMYIRDHCKDDPTLKMCLDKGMIDNISNHTIQQSAWSITWLKMKRHEIDKWRMNGERDGHEDFDNNILTKTMVQIEKRLEAAGVEFEDNNDSRMAKYEMIAMVLSGKTLHDDMEEMHGRGLYRYGWDPGATISIFESDFNEYREEFRENTESASCDPSKTDPDYFNYQVGGSDVLLLTDSQFTKILQKSSTSRWDFEEKARGLFTQIFTRYEDLKDHDPEALANFKKEITSKLDYWWGAGMDKSRKPTFIEDYDFEGNLIYKKLIELGLVTKKMKDSFEKLAEAAQGGAATAAA